MTVLLAAAACVGFAALIAGATGFGAALVATPLMLLVGVGVTEAVVINLFVGLATRVAAAYQLRAHMDVRRVLLLGGAAIPTAWLGALTVSMMPEDVLKPAVGALTILCGIAMALPSRREPVAPSTGATLAVGALGGYLSTTTSVNGPPPVLLLSRAKVAPMTFIADLAGYFVIANLASLALLAHYGDLSLSGTGPMLGACLAVALVANQVGIAIAQRLPVALFRAGVVTMVVASGAITIAVAA
ncbi:sulfite exporter TauE/SafE family protein [Nocardioides sp. GY 10113]|uniref:sulfite exporter TauE/SafE family protein n=1 Tax=Nocardioides sp. GY 10113 TaxID=2569761 RepID=UPI0010A77657|nr:sulfite exporter TauE/SafE family protein [Nocardioides sp. GY 10113]TIC89025.1 sulfite exporter TauE/SafE family protein [Nocardioides sp. GY 10113]